MAAALMQEPRLIVADEPTPGLEAMTARHVIRHLKRDGTGRAAVLRLLMIWNWRLRWRTGFWCFMTDDSGGSKAGELREGTESERAIHAGALPGTAGT